MLNFFAKVVRGAFMSIHSGAGAGFGASKNEFFFGTTGYSTALFSLTVRLFHTTVRTVVG